MTQIKALGIITIILGATGLTLGAISLYNVQTQMDTSSDDKWFTPVITQGFAGFIEGGIAWHINHSDTYAYLRSIFTCPETRTDWKICIQHRIVSAGTPTDSGKLYVGGTEDGEAYSSNNIFNGVNMDLAHPSSGIVYYEYSSTFTASAGEIIGVEWVKDDNAGGASGELQVVGIFLTHS